MLEEHDWPFAEAKNLLAIARLAGSVVRFSFENKGLWIGVQLKSDESPVSFVDLAADGVLRRLLSHCFPEEQVISEESDEPRRKISDQSYWLVDPLDATREFLKGNAGHFCVTFCRISKVAGSYQPVVGVVHDPVADYTLVAKLGDGAWACEHGKLTRCLAKDCHEPRILIENASSRNTLVTKLANRLGLESEAILNQGSALKIRAILHSEGAFYARPTKQKEWDVAAMILIARESGLRVYDFIGEEVSFNNPDWTLRRGITIAPDSIVSDVLSIARHLNAGASGVDLIDQIIR